MFGRKCVLSLALPFFLRAAGALDLDVNSPDSIKSTAKSLASGIIAAYNDVFEEDRIPGLFGDSYYFWEAGAVWNSLIEYSYLTSDSQFNDAISKGVQFQVSEGRNFMPANQTKSLGNDDQSTWALAALTAAEVEFPKPEEGEWVDLAKNVFDNQAMRWDYESCGGGLRWQIFTFNNGYNYKNSQTVGNFFLLGARLAQITKNETYSQWAEEAFKWAQEVGLISEGYSVFDGTDSAEKCSSINHIQWSSNLAIFAEGAAVMYNLTNGGNTWKDAVTGFANTSSIFQNEDGSVLYEVACETNGKCDTDQKTFKGIAARSLARAAISAPFAAESLLKPLQPSAKAAAQNCDGNDKDLACGMKWFEKNDDTESVSDGGLSEALAALEVVQSVLYSQAGSIGKGTSTSKPNGTSTGSGGPSGTATAAPALETGSAGRLGSAWGVTFAIAMFAILLC